jgi:nucleoside-diphosphate-sugar epimerase
MTERVLVTGAGGFMCSHVVAALLNAGYAVIALDRAFDPAWRTRFAGHDELLMIIESDATRLPDLPATVLIHGAALTADPEQAGLTPEQHLRANLDPLLTATAWARNVRVKRALFISSAGVYRRSVTTEPNSRAVLTEADVPDPESLYAVAKLTMETLVSVLRAEYGVPFATVRFGNVYGPHEIARPSRPRTSRLTRLIQTALTTGRVQPDHTLPADWTFAPDIGAALVALLRSECRHSLYNVNSGAAYSDHDLALAIQTHLPDLAVIKSPAAPVPARPPLSNARFSAETGFSAWTSLHRGIGQSIAWLREQASIPAGGLP